MSTALPGPLPRRFPSLVIVLTYLPHFARRYVCRSPCHTGCTLIGIVLGFVLLRVEAVVEGEE